MSINKSRRDFVKGAGLAILSTPIVLAATRSAAHAEDLAPVDEASDAMAKALGYHADGASVDPAKFPERKLPDGATRFCSNCILNTQAGIKLPGKDGEYVKCSLFQGKVVASKGWCKSWALKPGAA